MVAFRRLVFVVAIASLLVHSARCEAGFAYVQTNLVSSVPGLAANTDPNLKNPWGISSSATSPFWVSNQVTGTSTLYNSAGVPQALVVTVPTTGSGGPTGQVFNPASDFALATGGKAFFIFANLDGSISGWNPTQGTTAVVAVSGTGAAYTGLALGSTGGENFLYAADALGSKIDVYNGTFGPTSLAGSFTDPGLPSGFTVYNAQNLGGKLYVTYENETTGGGVVNAFDLNGNFLQRVSSNDAGGPLQSPWGMAIAPAGFGEFGGALLVGNEEDGRISAFNPTTGDFLGQLKDANGDPLANSGLWGLIFGNGGNGGDPGVLYFAAGIEGETEGLFGSIRASAVPEPSSLVLFGLGTVMVIGAVRSKRQRRS